MQLLHTECIGLWFVSQYSNTALQASKSYLQGTAMCKLRPLIVDPSSRNVSMIMHLFMYSFCGSIVTKSHLCIIEWMVGDPILFIKHIRCIQQSMKISLCILYVSFYYVCCPYTSGGKQPCTFALRQQLSQPSDFKVIICRLTHVCHSMHYT